MTEEARKAAEAQQAKAARLAKRQPESLNVVKAGPRPAVKEAVRRLGIPRNRGVPAPADDPSLVDKPGRQSVGFAKDASADTGIYGWAAKFQRVYGTEIKLANKAERAALQRARQHRFETSEPDGTGTELHGIFHRNNVALVGVMLFFPIVLVIYGLLM